MSEITMDQLNEVSGGSSQIRCFQYRVQRGDCLSVLAMRYNTTVDMIMQVNNSTPGYKIENRNLIHEGQIILIPVA